MRAQDPPRWRCSAVSVPPLVLPPSSLKMRVASALIGQGEGERPATDREGGGQGAAFC